MCVPGGRCASIFNTRCVSCVYQGEGVLQYLIPGVFHVCVPGGRCASIFNTRCVSCVYQGEGVY